VVAITRDGGVFLGKPHVLDVLGSQVREKMRQSRRQNDLIRGRCPFGVPEVENAIDAVRTAAWKCGLADAERDWQSRGGN